LNFYQFDLKEIGKPFLKDALNTMALKEEKIFSGLMTLQVSSVKNASQTSKRQEYDSYKSSGDIPRMMTIFLSDGHVKVRAVEFDPLEKMRYFCFFGWKRADFFLKNVRFRPWN
jgi:hypothetical protein